MSMVIFQYRSERFEVAMRILVALLPVAFASVASAQVPPTADQRPADQSVADAATFGAVATLAPLCGVRNEAWAADLRRAAQQAVTGSTATDDAGLSRAPGNGRAVAALGYGDMEALEDFAADTPAATCAALKMNRALGRADAAVDRFRRRRDGKPVG
jgi:hypothetical protein